jgi:hypothetical protein
MAQLVGRRRADRDENTRPRARSLRSSGLSSASIRSLIERCRINVIAAIRMLSDAGKIRRNDRSRWIFADEIE